jgi:chemotaxis protein MotB
MLAGQLGGIPNRVSIEGHTDAQPYASTDGYGNWELSTDRANAARRAMQSSGLRRDQVSQVRGFADQKLRVPADPMDPSNRRISLIVQYVTVDAPPVTASSGPLGKAAPDAKAAAAEASGAANAPGKTGNTPPSAANTADQKANSPVPTKSAPAKPAAGKPPGMAAGAESEARKTIAGLFAKIRRR